MEGLEGLGVSVQSQETLENDIIEKLEEKIKVKEQEVVLKQVKKELTSISTKIRENLKRKRHCERQIRSIYKSESNLSSQKTRQISSLLNDQEGFERALTELFASQTANLQRLKESNYDFDSDPELKVLIIKHENETVEDAEDEEEANTETELQKNIRLGDVTAFGNVLQTRSSNQRDEVNFDSYLQQQIGEDFNAASSSRKRRLGECSDDSDSGFVDVLPKKREKTASSENKSRIKTCEPQGDSDWKPESSDEDVEEQEPLIKKKEVKKSSKPQRRLYDEDEVGWRTDDSDFDGTDDEAETPKRKRTRHGDDGDKDLYLARVTGWQQKRSEEDKALDGRYEELEGGLRVASSLWKKLYNYQRVGVQWMFELHQQQVCLETQRHKKVKLNVQVGGILGDEMGLGKTIQVIAFLASLSYTRTTWPGDSWRGLGPSIILAPTTLLHQWVSEFHKWWPPLRVAVLHSSGSHTGSKLNLVRAINSSHGVLIMSYQAITSHIDIINKFNWHYAVLDEGQYS